MFEAEPFGEIVNEVRQAGHSSFGNYFRWTAYGGLKPFAIVSVGVRSEAEHIVKDGHDEGAKPWCGETIAVVCENVGKLPV